MTASPFELRVIRLAHHLAGKRHEGEYGVALYQQPIRPVHATPMRRRLAWWRGSGDYLSDAR